MWHLVLIGILLSVWYAGPVSPPASVSVDGGTATLICTRYAETDSHCVLMVEGPWTRVVVDAMMVAERTLVWLPIVR